MAIPARIEDIIEVARATSIDDSRTLVDRLVALASHGLGSMYLASDSVFPQTARGLAPGAPLAIEGTSVRYTAIAALGIARLPLHDHGSILAGGYASDLLDSIQARALAGEDSGAVALAAWASAEIPQAADPAHQPTGNPDDLTARVVERLCSLARSNEAIPTVDHSWILTALLAVRHRAISDNAWASALGTSLDSIVVAAQRAAQRLLDHQGGHGVFPHHLPPSALSRLRSHVGCFADQIYPIQALARYSAAMGDPQALDAAGMCAHRICALQGPEGQWWWHYDSRTGEVVEGYPVYSVHQHGMAPMALLELREAGGPDLRRHVADGLAWIVDPPESLERLIRDDLGVVWRKIGRREPRKFVRSVRTVTTSLRPGLRLGALDRAFPPGPVDRECRPYELGWLLYAWLGDGLVTALREASITHQSTTP